MYNLKRTTKKPPIQPHRNWSVGLSSVMADLPTLADTVLTLKLRIFNAFYLGNRNGRASPQFPQAVEKRSYFQHRTKALHRLDAAQAA